jgi:hypothetical protein
MRTDRNQEQEHEWSIDRRRCLIRELLRLTNLRGVEWLRGFVAGRKWWAGIREDFLDQRKRGNVGQPGDWRE